MLKQIKFLNNYCKSRNLKINNFFINTKTGKTSLIYINSHENQKTIIFTHGFGNDKYYPFIELFTKFLENGFSIITFDLPGHGKDNSTLFSIKSSINTLEKVILFSKKKLKINEKNIILLGHSLGGSLCLYESSKNSFGGIIIIGSPYKIEFKKTMFLEILSFFYIRILSQLKIYSINGLIPSFGILKRKYYPLRMKSVDKIKTMSEQLEKINILEKIKNTRIPCLQIHGKFDLISPINQALVIKKNYKGKIKSVYLNHTHLTIIYSKDTINEIIKWLKKI
ncbi:MAG: alpha/beta fold hydrolase [Nanoarchaeota archaeon]|nr:alpha/beta fold hydrolase [Nanoarchaeota archaeon]